MTLRPEDIINKNGPLLKVDTQINTWLCYASMALSINL